MISSRPILSRDARSLASTSYSVGKASMKILYSMWSSTVIPAVGISAARPSILPISLRGLLTGALLEQLRRRDRWDLAPVVRGPYHARSAAHASPGEVYLCRIPLSLLLFRAVDRKFHASACMWTRSRLYPLPKSTELSVSNSPTGTY